MAPFRPLVTGTTLPDRLIACAGGGIAVALTALFCRAIAPADMPVLVAAIGGSATLIFAVPASPLAQPWAVIGGHTLSALAGVAVYRLVPHEALAAGIAVGAAMIVMSLCRCLHPPGGATALAAVIGTPAVHATGFGFALVPVGINALAMVALAVMILRATGHSYPHRAAPLLVPHPFARRDVDAALAEMHESFDIAREDLEALLARAEAHAAARPR